MKIIDETFFVDTNVLVAATDRSRASHPAALSLLRHVIERGGHLAWSGQVIREYLVVATRPQDVNGLGLDPSEASDNVRRFSGRLRFLKEDASVSHQLGRLVKEHNLKGKRIHDANIVATMVAAGVSKLVTDDSSDYRVFDDHVERFQPSDIVG